MEQYAKYLRKSRFDRDYAELSIEETLKRHEQILDKLAQDRGYHIAKTYYEVVSGESIAARPEIQKLLEEVNAGLYTGVLVVDLERLARGNSADQAYISQVFQFSETKIVTPMKVYDPTNEFDEEYFEFGLFMSRREYKTINRRLIRGRDSSASEGKYISSIAPYGYKRVKLENEKGFTLEPVPEEAEVVKRVFNMYLHHAGTKIIANRLNDDGVPTRHGGLWEYSTIAQMLSNEVYMGKIRRGWSKQFKTIEDGVVKKHIRRAKPGADYKLYDGLHPPLISEETFCAAQTIREENYPSARVKRETELQNAFAGLIFCAKCGKRIGRTTGTVSRGAIPRLRCVNGRNCHNVSADYDVVEREIISALRSWYSGYKVRITTSGFADDIERCRKQMSKLDDELTRLNAQLEMAYNLVECGEYTLELFKARRAKINGEIETAQARRNGLEAMLSKLETGNAEQSSFIPNTEKLLESYGEMTVKERNDLLKTILHKIVYFKDAEGKITIDLYPRLPKL